MLMADAKSYYSSDLHFLVLYCNFWTYDDNISQILWIHFVCYLINQADAKNFWCAWWNKMIMIKLFSFLNVQYFLRKTEKTSIFPLKLDSPALWIYCDFLLQVLFLTGGTASLVCKALVCLSKYTTDKYCILARDYIAASGLWETISQNMDCILST